MNRSIPPACLIITASVFVLALTAGMVVARVGGLNRPASGDGPYYSGLARAMADRKGYVLDRSPWPHSPDLGRLPLWPVILTPPMWLWGAEREYAVLRCTTVSLHALASALLVLLTSRIWLNQFAAGFAGVLFALYPPALALIDAGYSEHAWIVMATAAFMLLFGQRWKQFAGAALLGISVLARSNVLILPFMFAIAALLWRPELYRHCRRFIALTAVFLVPSAVWITRNYAVSGDFPILSAMEGETFYGANNAVVASGLDEWGYWVFPDLIPGEVPKQVLGKRMTEAELNRYYRQKGISYVRSHWLSYPRLILGKLIRGFLPIPWIPRMTSYLTALPRVLLYVAFFCSLRSTLIPNATFGLLMVALLLVTILTTVIFYGTFRFTLCLEPYVICCVAAWLAQHWKIQRERPKAHSPAHSNQR